MENTDNKPHKEESPAETTQTRNCCSILFTSREDGSKKPSPLLWGILAVFVIGLLGIASSGKGDQKKADIKSHSQTAQLQKPATQVSDKEVSAKKMEALQEAHHKQMEQAHKAFEVLKSAYAKKLNETIDAMKAEQAIQAQEAPNPELNFQLRGVSNVRVQFNKAKDISYIEIIQPDGKKSWESQKGKEPTTNSYQPKKVKEGNKYDKCEPKSTGACATTEQHEAPKWDKKSNQSDWNCTTSGQQSGCWQ